MSINHIGLPVSPSTFKVMRDFYLAALKPLGYSVYMEKSEPCKENGDGAVFIGFKNSRHEPNFWLHGGAEGDVIPLVDPANYQTEELRKKQPVRAHVAFDAGSRRAVDEWYRTAIKAGGIDNGRPGERSYVKGYYAAYVIDPLGNNIEVVHFNPLWLQAIKAAPNLVTLVVGVVSGVLAYRYVS